MASPTDAGMPGDVGLPSEEIEQTALLILQVLEAARERIYPDEESIARLEPHVGRIKARYGEIRGRSFSEAYQVSRVEFIRAAILSLIRPAFEAKEREIRQLRLQVNEDRQTNAISLACAYEQSRALQAKLAQAVEAMEPFARAANCWEETMPDETLVFGHYPSAFGGQTELRFSDFRRARSASRGETTPLASGKERP